MILANPQRFVVREVNRVIANLLLFWASHRIVLMRLAMIFGLLGLAPLVGKLVAEENPLFIFIALALPLGLLVLHLILPRFGLAPSIILFAAAFVPLDFSTGTESRLVDSLLLTLLFVSNWLMKMLLVDKRLHLYPSPVNKPLLAFMVVTLIALCWSMIFRDVMVITWGNFSLVQVASALVMIMLPAAFLLVGNHVGNLRQLKAMAGLMWIAGVIAIVDRLNLVPIAIINDGGLFTMWVVSLSLSMAFFNHEWSWKWRSFFLSLALAWVYFRFGQQITWLAGWLPTFVAIGVIFFLRSKKVFAVALIVVTVIFIFKADYFLNDVFAAENAESGQTRMAAWEVNWRVTGKHLLFGTGPAGYAVYYMSYYPEEGMATHNNYIDIIAQTGIFGLIFCVWFFFSLAWLGYKLCLRLKGRGDFVEGLANAALAGTVGCIVAMAFGDWLFPFAYTQTIAGFDYVVYSWLFMGTIVALDRLYPASDPGKSSR